MQGIFQCNILICPIYCENTLLVWEKFPVFHIVYWVYFVYKTIAYTCLAAPYFSVWWLVATRHMTPANMTMSRFYNIMGSVKFAKKQYSNQKMFRRIFLSSHIAMFQL